MPRSRLYAKIAVNLFVTLLSVLLLIWLGPKLLRFFIPFVIAYIISSIANPLVRFMEKRVKIVRRHGSAIIIIVVIAAILGVLYFLISILTREIISLVNDIPNIARQLNDVLDQFSDAVSKFGTRLPTEVKDLGGTLYNSIEDFLSGLFNGVKMPIIFQTASSYLKIIANGFLLFIITIIASYFFIADRDKFIESFKRIFPDSMQKGYRLVMESFRNALGGYFKAQFKIMLILLLIMWLTFQFMGISYSFLIAAGISFIDFLPVFGTGLILGPWVIILFVTGNYIHAVIMIVLYLACQLIKQLLQPKMVGDSIGISPMAALIFMFIGYRLLGVFGMIIGIPVGMILINFYHIGIFERLTRGFRVIINDINEFRKF